MLANCMIAIVQRSRYGPWIGALFLLLGSLHVSAQQAENVSEYKLKAAFIYNFSQFIEWPESSFSAPDAPFQICVVGDDPFGEILKPIQKRKYHTHPIEISYPKTVAEAESCRILYLDTQAKASQWRDIIKNLGDTPVLTVTSNNDAMESGFCIGFVSLEGKTRWNMNLAAARKAQLKISAKLIEISVMIVGEGPR